jgi:LDH2 family malate/lactate/ureidoglycolate dehydrogenase
VSRVAIDELRQALAARALELGFDNARAGRLAEHYVDAELRGARGHGAERMRWLHGFDDIRPVASPRLVERREGLARYDSDGLLGYLALAEALDAELADPPDGARLVVVGDCFPTGRLGWFAEMGAAAGLVTLVTATSTARISHPDGSRPLLGTNPLCLALPGNPPTVVDVSMGRTTYGSVLAAAAAGRRLPQSLAVTPEGAAETDPQEVISDRSGIAPFGGDQAHKGFALALLVELLCTALAGTPGHAAVVLLAQPQAAPAEELRAALADRRFPGDGSRERRAQSVARGFVELPDDLWRWLQEGSAASSVSSPSR